MQTTAPLADSSINDRLVELCPFVYQSCFEFLELSYPQVLNLLHTPDAVVYQVKVLRIADSDLSSLIVIIMFYVCSVLSVNFLLCSMINKTDDDKVQCYLTIWNICV